MAKPPTTELGSPFGYGGAGFYRDLIRQMDNVPEMRWPRSVRTLGRMLNDVQIGGLYRATTLPIMRFNWYIEQGNANPEAAARFADDVGLPLMSGDEEVQPARVRSKHRVNWSEFLGAALDALGYGFYAFEQVGEIEGGWFRLRKLAERPPWTVEELLVAKDGGLDGIRQPGEGPNGYVDIPIDRLVMFVWGKRGARWEGRPIIRELFVPWLFKDDLARVDVVKHRRNGMGVPFIEMGPGAGPAEQEQAEALAAAYRAGDAAGGALPDGFKLRFAGVEGQLPDTIGSVRYWDEAMARNMLLMVVQLGQTRTGSRALSQTFADMFSQGIQAFADWAVRTFNAHVAEDWFDWNEGPGSEICQLKYDAPDDPNLAVMDLKALIDAGAITVDAELEDWLRLRHRMPARQGPFNPQPPAPAPGDPQQARRLTASLSWPRAWRRDLTEAEIASGVDFAALDQSFHVNVDEAVSSYLDARGSQFEELAAQVRDGSNAEELALIQATPVGQEILSGVLQRAAKDGVNSALDEAFVQGVQIDAPDVNEGLLDRRAHATSDILASALSEAAARKAVQLAHDGVGTDEVATRVVDHLQSLSDSFVRDQIGGAVMAATNHGRESVFEAHEPEAIYSTELLDTNVCGPCRSVDGKRYASLREAQDDYPTGGYHACQGGVRCRGSLVVIWPTNDGG